ncbi:aminopeptidase N [Legionella longbeachae]|uniref:Aminopeptidase N n=1 Tax=Legionella longbeachae serogroup 1 (strain NSW150) TaxID=661367 RepID=D3HSS9_LEGLN|nr:aminopeptidase N [Legionella longbeachae]VEE02461.1 aminopeptidase [Legionella oakridgensis]HBD7398053.1 aminopeptidase N [Legionella pneumophila]ARB91264.1 aminopeptidase N [Legionella longbeachae]ARM32311.1 aminopeptidase N [Legionella longbeachae]EEZ94892.1 aminopeptidase N [Legionella longbeachae D-4968]
MKNHSGIFRLDDYQVLDYLVKHVDLEIDLSKEPVQSKACLIIEPNPKSSSYSVNLELDGENMTLESIALNGKILLPEEYEITKDSLVIKNVPQGKTFKLETITRLGKNTDLFGLYETEGTILVKAETEGLRRVLYCHDRPDNLATYKTTIIAKKIDYPILLSNGTLIEQKDLNDELHSVTWFDKVPKPSYLFALVAGKLQKSVTYFKTRSERMLPIEFYVPPQATTKCDFAKEALKEAMRWEENIFNLECDLPQHMVAGVDKYASGASEPTGLNLFNTANLFATPETRTDNDILRVLEVVAHEYFHYWSGDRVTIRDWFNLPFKEGLTTFRAAMLREHLFGSDLIRILDGKNLDERAPRQDTYTNVRSLYTPAAYEKSADIFRMIMLSLGEKDFYAGMTQFLKDHDGEAVTLENVLDSLSTFTAKDIHRFLKWFTESGIPQVTVTDAYNAETKRYTLKFETRENKERPIPVVVGLLNNDGAEILNDTLITVDEPEMEFHFDNINAHPTPSLLRSFSAPIILEFTYSTEQLLLLMQHDTNFYNRCEAAKKLITRLVSDYCLGKSMILESQFFQVYRNLLNESTHSLNYWLLAELLTIPSEEILFAELQNQDFEKISQARQLIQNQLATELKEDLLRAQKKPAGLPIPGNAPFKSFDIFAAGIRRLKHVYHEYLLSVQPEKTEQELVEQFNNSLGKNMTDCMSALNLLLQHNSSKSDLLLEHYYHYWQDDVSAVNYWFNVQAAAHTKNVGKNVTQLMSHPAFDLSNPNKVNALLGTFIKNPYGFHASSGEGYQLIVDVILQLEKINPTLAANLTEKFNNWDKYNEKRQKLILHQLEFLSAHALTTDVRNMAKKGLDKKGKLEPPLPITQFFFSSSSLINLPIEEEKTYSYP